MKVSAVARRTALALLGAVLAIHQHVIWSAAPSLRARDDVEPAPFAIVLGASVRPDDTPSHMLADRLDTAVDLARAGLAETLLLSGDGGGDGYDEVAVMRDYVVARGVAPDRVLLDHAGFRTIETMRRARHDYGVEHAIVVTNPFHLHRAVFLAHRCGIRATGVAARGHSYSAGVIARHMMREWAARGWAWVETIVLGRVDA